MLILNLFIIFIVSNLKTDIMTTIYDKQIADEVSNGTYKVGVISELTYNDLVAILGEPTYNEETGDGKVQVEWVVEFGEDYFTIYDWKTFDREYTLNENTIWNVGGKGASFDFIYELERSKEDI